MEQWLSKLYEMTTDVDDLVGAVAFGQSRLQQFHDALQVLEQDIQTIQHYQHYQTTIQEHRRIMAMLHTTIQSLNSWRTQAGQHEDVLADLCAADADVSHPLVKTVRTKIACLLGDVARHIQELQKMHAKIAMAARQLDIKKSVLQLV
ncbi:MAG: hypothetical protein K2Q14_06150 [Gammaproteobacteria bacterium]|nr:hypothetical protein [Gammaproteobacteria bacterium]